MNFTEYSDDFSDGFETSNYSREAFEAQRRADSAPLCPRYKGHYDAPSEDVTQEIPCVA